MVIKQIIGNVNKQPPDERVIDYVDLDWFETSKRILHKKTRHGIDLVLKFLHQQHNLSEGDILFADGQRMIVVFIKTCDVIFLKPGSIREMAIVCYEIGNKHLPLFYDDGDLILPYEAPIFKMLEASGFTPRKGQAKLLNQLKTTVAAHNHTESKSLFSRILQLTSPNE